MNTEMKQEMERLLDGTATIPEKQDLMCRFSDSDFEAILKDESLQKKFERYQEQNPIHNIADVYISLQQLDETWNMVLERAKESVPFHLRFKKAVQKVLLNIFPFEQPFWKYGVAVATLLVLVGTPVLYQQFKSPKSSLQIGMRGPSIVQKATLEYSILGADNKLHRPDRVLHESDTLAFRVHVQEDGYCSIYVINKDQADQIILDTYLKKGSHDISSGYQLEGSQGENRIVLIFSNSPVSIDEDYIISSINNKVTSLTINETSVSIFQRELNVE